MAQCPAVADFNFHRICNNGFIQFEDNSHLVGTGLIVDYHWDFDDGVTISTQNPSHNFVPGSTYDVKLMVTDSSGCKDTIIKPVYVAPLPVASFTFTPQNICSSNTINFSSTSTGTGLTYFWDFDDGTTETIQNPSHNLIRGSTYNVKLVVTDSYGCKDSITLPVYINPLPIASFNFTPNNVCSGSTINFSDASTGIGLTHSWNFGDGGSSTGQDPSHIFTSYGCSTKIFNASLIVTDINGCTSSTTHQISILQQPEVLFLEDNDFTFCNTDTSYVQNVATVTNYSPSASCIVSYTIDWGDGSPIDTIFSPFNTINHTYTTLGYHTVVFTATGANGCVTTDIQTATIESNPVAVLVGPPTGTNVRCIPLNICITNLSQNISPTTTLLLEWGDGFSQSLSYSTVGDTLCHSYNKANCVNGSINEYVITLTAQNACDISTTTWAPIKVYEPPQASFYPQRSRICLGEQAVFINNTKPNSCAASPFTFYTWDFGDGTTSGPTPVNWSASPQQTVTHTYATNGTYTVTLTAENNSNNGCGKTVTTRTITISETFPNFSADSVCYGYSTKFEDLSSASGGATVNSWYWTFGDGYSSSSQNPSHTYNSWGDKNVCLTVNTDLGCSKKICRTIHVKPLPTASFSAPIVCLGDAMQFTNSSHGNNGATIVSNSWTFGDNSSSTETNPSHIYATAGTYTVRLTVTDSKGCVNSTSRTVRVSPLPIANFTADIACLNSATHFQSTATAQYGSINQREWYFGDGGTATGGTVNHTYADTGYFNVTHIVVTNYGCRDTIISPVYVSPNPDANFSATTVCLGNPTSFTDLSEDYGVNIVSWRWNFGDGSSIYTGTNPTHTYPRAGTFYVTLTVRNVHNCTDQITLPVVVDSLPVANFTSDPACLGFPNNFYDASIPHGSDIVSWEWDFGDLSTSTDTNPTHTYDNFGNHNVSLLVTNARGCKDSIILPVVVYEPPIADFGWDGSCLGLPTIFSDSSSSNAGSITNWQWDFGEPLATSTEQNPSYTYTAIGSFDVTLIVFDNNGCSDTTDQSVYVSDLPTADFSSVSACAKDTVFFTDLSNGNGSTITSWEWDFGDLNTSTDTNPTHQFATSGDFNVQLIVTTDYGCHDTIVRTVVVDSLPTANFSNLTVCLGDSTHFTDNSLANGGTINSWYWDFGDGNSDNQQNPSHLYLTDGTFNVTLVVENTIGCIDSITIPVVVRPLPIPDFNWQIACVNQEIHFNDLSSGNSDINSWYWEFGDIAGGTANIQNPIYIYSDTGLYNVTLTVTDIEGCSNNIDTILSVETVPTAEFSADSVCFGNSTPFTDLSNGNGSVITSWNWSFGNGHNSTGQDQTYQYNASGTYNVQLIVSNAANCADTVNNDIFVKPKPQASYNFSNVCDEDSVNFQDASISNSIDIISWAWNFGDSNTSSFQNISHTYGTFGIYEVELIVENDYGCFDTTRQNVEVYQLPDAEFMASVACLGFPTSFQSLSTPHGVAITDWQWDFGDGVGTSIEENPTWTYAAGTPPYDVSLTIQDANGCRDSVHHFINLHPQPTVDFSATTACSKTATEFKDLSQATVGGTMQTWNWDFGDGGTSTLQDPSHTYSPVSVVTTFDVTLIATDNNGCPDTTTHEVTVNPQPTADFSSNAVCSGNTTIFQDLSSAVSGITIDTWSWDFGDGTGNSNIANPTYVYNPVSDITNFNTVLIITDSNGCSDTTNKYTVVNPLPIPYFSATTACSGHETEFNDLSHSNGGNISDWTWDFGDASGNSTLQSPHYIYSTVMNPTTFNVNLIVEDINGCVDDTTISVTVNPLPIVDFSNDPTCSGLPSSFVDLSHSTGGDINTWSWNFGDGTGTANIQSPYYTYSPVSDITTFDVTLIATDINGCFDSITNTITVNPKPIASFTSDTVCSGDTTTFKDFSSNVSGITIDTWSWDFGDGTGSSNIANPTYAYNPVPNITNFNTVLIITDSNGCSDTTNKYTVVNPLPIPYFSATTACSGDETEFNDLSHSNGGDISDWTWDFGDASGNSTLQSPHYIYSTVMYPTTFNVNLIVEDINGCVNDTTINVLVNPLPIADFSTNPTCSGYPNSFFDASYSTGGDISTWNWNFGDGETSDLPSPDHTYPLTATIDTFDVSLIVTDVNGCIDTVVHQATVIPSPMVNFVSDSVCSGTIAQFNDLSSTLGGTIISRSWNFGDGNGVSNEQNPNYLYDNVNVTTPYQVQLIVENSFGCIDSIEQTAIVYPLPIPDFSTDIVCFGGTTSFSDLSSSLGGDITDWQWNFGDGIGGSALQNPQYTYGSHGLYPVDLVVTDINNCQNTIQHTVIVDSLPIPSFTWTATCQPGIINFTNTSNGNGSNITSYYWNFDDGSMAISQSPIHLYSSLGTYDVSLTVNNDRGCSNAIVVPVSVEPGLEVDFTADDVCLGEETYFYYSLVNQNMAAQTWYWDFGDGKYSTNPNPTHLYTQSGIYNVLLTSTDSLGCDFTIAKHVTVYVKPIADFNSTIVLVNNPTAFTDNSYTADGFIASWHWDFGDGGTSTQQNPLHTYANAGTYMATLIVFNNFGCSDTITIPVIVNSIVNADFVADTVCSGSPTSFTDLSTAGAGTIISWYWNFGNGYASTQQNPQHVYVADGIYVVTLTVTADNGVSNTISKQVVVLESPMADFTYTEVCFGNPTGLTDHSYGVNYPVSAWQWNLGDGNTSSQSAVQYFYNASGQWQVQLIVTNTIGCTDTVVKTINVWEVPQVNFEATPREGCAPLNVHFDDITAVSDGIINSWLWNFGDGYTSVSAKEATHYYPMPGLYNVGLTVVSNHGCTGSLTIPNMIQVYPLPIASFSFRPNTPSISDEIEFIDLSFGSNQWFWDFGDNSFSDIQSPRHYYLLPGSYNVTQVVHNEYGCADTTNMEIRLNTSEILWAPNAISVNNDGINEVFNVYGMGWSSDNFDLRIFNRWGEEIYHTDEINKGWDGTDQNTGSKVHIGVYVWRLKIMSYSNEIFKYIGTVTVIE